jgi:GNAT superfamily N-acetyltransferase
VERPRRGPVHKGYQGRGLTYHLATTAVDFARERGVRALEAYSMITQPSARQAFEDAGFTEVSHG